MHGAGREGAHKRHDAHNAQLAPYLDSEALLGPIRYTRSDYDRMVALGFLGDESKNDPASPGKTGVRNLGPLSAVSCTLVAVNWVFSFIAIH